MFPKEIDMDQLLLDVVVDKKSGRMIGYRQSGKAEVKNSKSFVVKLSNRDVNELFKFLVTKHQNEN